MNDIFEIQSYIETTENDPGLYEEKNFEQRLETIDLFEFQVIERIEFLQHATQQAHPLHPLQTARSAHPAQVAGTLLEMLLSRAKKVRTGLQEVNSHLFQRLRENIRIPGCTGRVFRELVSEYIDFGVYGACCGEQIGYDNLDAFINELFSYRPVPEQTRELEPEMVYFQKTPARVVFELTEQCVFGQEDVFVDLGSGLGQAAILINFLTGIPAKGIEIDPTLCEYAQDCTASLNLPNVTFINADAREADYSEGTVFFMYTPFRGKIMQTVLDMLKNEASRRKIRIVSYGPCIEQVAMQGWLKPVASRATEGFSIFSH